MLRDLKEDRRSATSVPYFLVSKALCEFEDGWAAFRFMATCRSAEDAGRFIHGSLRRTGRALLGVCHYLQEDCPFLPGFEPEDELAVALQPIITWDPPCHASILIDPPHFMLEHFQYGSQGNMKAWIQCTPFFGLRPLDALRAMNHALQGSAAFQEFVGILLDGKARFFYSPIVYDADHPMNEQLVPGPGLIIALRYQSLPVAFCFRYTDYHYLTTMVMPWIAENENLQDDSPDRL